MLYNYKPLFKVYFILVNICGKNFLNLLHSYLHYLIYLYFRILMDYTKYIYIKLIYTLFYISFLLSCFYDYDFLNFVFSE